MIYHWVNLTNGLQALYDYNLPDYRVMRLQSTHCEQKRWFDVLASIPDDFLFHVALGDECRVYDYGAHKTTSRAVWQGLEWVKFVLYRNWLDIAYKPEGRAHMMGAYFAEQMRLLPEPCVKRVDYYKPMVTGAIRITSVTSATAVDGHKDYFFRAIYCNNEQAANRR